MPEEHETLDGPSTSSGRREFLVKAGRFAAVTPAAVTVLLSTSMDAAAGVHKSGGGYTPRNPKKPKQAKKPKQPKKRW